MILLAVDTSTTQGTIALADRAGEIHEHILEPGQPHSQTLLPGIETVLASAGLSREDVQAIAVGVGPGAFTSLRVGLATMKGWSAAAGIPIVPVVSLDAVALPVLGEGKSAMVMADARKGELYTAYYPGLDDHGVPDMEGEIQLVTIEGAAGRVKQFPGNGSDRIRLAGTGVPYLLEHGVDPSLVSDGDEELLPLAINVLAIASITMELGKAVDPSAIIPVYVRPPDALPPRAGTVVTGVETRVPGPRSRDSQE